MSGTPAIFRQRDLEKAIKAYAKAGIEVRLRLENGVPVFERVKAGDPKPDPALDASEDICL